MSKMDKKYLEIADTILEDGYFDNNRTGISTYKLPHQIMQFNLEKEFPILTTKFVAFKTAVKEMLWIFKDQSNDVKKLQEQNVKIWDEWGIYSTSQDLVYVFPKKKERPKKLEQIKISEIVNINATKGKSNNYGDYYILDKDWKKQRARIQFCDTGFLNDVPLNSISTGELKDPFVRTVNSVGYYGEYKSLDILNYFGKHHKRWVNTWENMIRRCTGQYSGKGDWYSDVFVDTSFQCCEYFLRWVMKNNRYTKDHLGELQLDKDYYGANYYGEDSCTLLTSKENTDLTLNKWYKMNDKVFFSKADIAKHFQNDLRLPKTHKPNGQYNDYNINKYISTFEELEELVVLHPNKVTDKGLLRFSLETDITIKRAYGYQVEKYHQMDKLIETLKTNPQDRRMMILLWNIEDLPEMSLQPCCFLTLWDVSDGKLNCMLIQRSGDWGLGVPFNTAQYAVLVHMVAQVTGLKPGLLTHVINNAHIYENHVEALKLQLTRKDEAFEAPKFWINPEIKDFYDFTADDVKLIEYKHHGKLDMEVAV